MTLSINPNQPIPNGPFYYPETWYLQGALGPLITGAGLCINNVTGTISAIGGGGGGSVTSITAGAGLTGGTITSTGTIALQTTGITPGLYPRASVTVDQYGRITNVSANPVPGTVCSITTGTGLTGGTITQTGTISITPTGVTAGTYSYPRLTVNPQGQITTITSCTAVDSLCAGPGLCVVGGGGPITSSGTLALTNTGAIPGNYTLANITVDAQGRISTVNNGTAVTCVCSGTGLTGGPITGVGTLCLSNTGVSAGCYLAADICVDAQGRITAASCGQVVTCVATGVGLTGGPILSTGTVALAPVSPTSAGSYAFANVTVDIYGRVTAASASNLSTAITGNAPITVSGTPTSVAISIQDGTTTQRGAVSLIDNVATNDNTKALTAAQGYSLQQQISALAAASNLTLAGTFDALAGQMLTVSVDGAGAGFVVGSNLPAPAAGNANFFVIVTTPGTYTPPLSSTYTTTQGDWFLSDGTVWQFLNVGDDKPYATILSPGIIELATEAEVKAGTDSTLAVTPLTLFCNYVAKTSYTNKGDILVASANETYSALTVSSTNGSPIVACNACPLGVTYGPLPINQNILLAKGDLVVAMGNSQATRLAAGLDGYVLTACSTDPLGVVWVPGSTNFIPCSQITGVGSLITGSAAGVPSSLGSSNNNGDVLVVCTACSNGLAWCTLPASIPTACITNKGVILTGTSANNPIAFGPGTDGYVLAACALCPSGLYWTPFPAAIPCSLITAKGEIVAGGSASTPLALPVGTDGQVLTACAACTTGLAWAPASTPSIPCACITGKGALVSGSAASTPVALPVGTDGQVLTACAACTTGLTWAPASTPAIPCSLLTAKGDMIVASGASTPVALSVGTDGYSLVACSACTNGVTWACVQSGAGLQDTPVGQISWFGTTTAPTGWLPADGRAVSRVGYADLFAVIGTTFGAGNGSTTFNLPDLRGQFVRGWDAAGGTPRGLDLNRIFGSNQIDSFKLHGHNFCYGFASFLNNSCYVAGQSGSSGLFSQTYPEYFSACSVQQCGGTETRPTNISLMPCIKYEKTVAPSTPTSGIPCACITGKGALITGTAADTPVALPVGYPGQILVASPSCASGISWCDPSMIAIDAAVSYTVTAGTSYNNNGICAIEPGVCGVAFSISINTCNWLNPANGRFTPTVAGYYQVNAQVSTQNNTLNTWGGILKNGTILGQSINPSGPSGNWVSASYSTVVYMNGTTDYLQLGGALQGGTASYAVVNGLTGFSAALVGSSTTLPASYQVPQFNAFTSAGTVQSVGLASVLPNGSPGTTPSLGNLTQNNISYRQIGPKEWEVQGTLMQAGTGTINNGIGTYVLTLPNGLQFDTTNIYQTAYTGIYSSRNSLYYGLPNSQVLGGFAGDGIFTVNNISPYDATRYRLLLSTGTTANYWQDTYYQPTNGGLWFKWSFTFFTP